MGLIQAAVGAAGGVLADSWRDFFYCDSLDENTLAVKGQKRTSDKGRSSNVRGESNIISDGSIIAVNDGQCMIIVESGEIVDVCAEPGQFVYDRSSEPSLFFGDLEAGIRATFERIGQRFTFGGDTGKDQRIYFFNTKEIYGNKYGTTSPVPFRIVDANLGLDLDTKVRMNGEYSYKIVDPLLFYKNVCGNVEEPYKRDRLDSQMKSELLTALQPALARISEMGIRYSAIPAHTKELASILNDELSDSWEKLRGIKVVVFGVNSITLPEDVEQKIADRQMAQTMVDPNQAAAVMTNAAADAMRDAANNTSGAVNAFMGMGMAQGMGGGAATGMFQQGAAGTYQQPQSAYPMADGGGFGAQPFEAEKQRRAEEQAAAAAAAAEAEAKAEKERLEAAAAAAKAEAEAKAQAAKQAAEEAARVAAQAQEQAATAAAAATAMAAAVPTDSWACPQCGTANTGKFCGECGTPKPIPEPPAEWACPQCGTTNAGKFCGECGTPRP